MEYGFCRSKVRLALCRPIHFLISSGLDCSAHTLCNSFRDEITNCNRCISYYPFLGDRLLSSRLLLRGVFYSISKGLPAGVAAVVTSLQPVLVSLLAVKVLGEQLRVKQVVGLALGLIGVVLVLGPSFEQDIPVSSVVGILVALTGSTSATLLQKKIGTDVPLISGTAYQYLASGVVLGIAAVATGGTRIQWSGQFVVAFVWLIAVLSVGAILLLLWLLNTGSAASVSSLLYLVPPATALEAFFLFGKK